MPDPSHPSRSQRPFLGLGLVALTVFFFALSDVLTKYLALRHPVPAVVAVRYLASLAILMILVWPRLRSRLWQAKRPGLLVLRGIVLALASLTLGVALKLMPVGETIAIVYLSPFAVMALAVPLLGEKVNVFGWVFAALGFVGVLLILRPGGGLDPVGVVWALTNAGLATIFHLMTRALSQTESAIAMLFHVTLAGAIFSSLSALPSLGELNLTWLDLGAMVALGALATSGHFLFASAYRQAPASLIAPANYLHLVWAAILGWLFFGHAPALLSAVGMVMIVGAGIALAINAHLSRVR